APPSHPRVPREPIGRPGSETPQRISHRQQGRQPAMGNARREHARRGPSRDSLPEREDALQTRPRVHARQHHHQQRGAPALPDLHPRTQSSGYRMSTEMVHHNGSALSEQMSFARMVTASGGQSILPDAYKGNPANVLIAVGDRKSTRLNSSHVKISYAVFCLKKKK